jgi:acetyl-CoA carboxylase biotin carboxyl carrier protein
MIDIRKLKELVRLMVENDLTEINLQDQSETVAVKRGSAHPVTYVTPSAPPAASHAPAPTPTPTAPTAPAASTPAASDGVTGNLATSKPADPPSDAGLVAIVSPMVGTFYTSPNPDSPPFVKPGSPVTPDTTVCLVEAMKVFNEIKAETTGTIERVLVQSGQPVEYGQKLFLVRPA